jgi:hypothetical protein
LPNSTVPVPDGFSLLEDPKAKLAREMEHKPFVPGISDSQLEAIKEQGPAIAGGTAFGLMSGGLGFAGAAGMTALGGGLGEGMKDLYNYFYDNEKAPKGFEEQMLSIAAAGGEQALMELGGRAIGSVMGAGYHVFRPKVKGGIDELQKQFAKYGGSFTQAQRTDAFLTQQVDSLTRGSISGRGIMQRADDINDVALNAWRNDLSNIIAKDAQQNMSSADFGKLMSNTLSDGKAGFKAYVGELYNSFDDLVKTNIKQGFITKEVPSSIVDQNGKNILYKQTEEVINEFRPVDVTPIKKSAAELMIRLKESANLAKSDFGGQTIEKILSLDDALKFSTAQDARSVLLELSRAAEASGETKLAGSLKYFSGQMTKAMDDAAKKQGADTYRKYLRIKKEAESGYKAFNSKFTYNLLKEDANLSKVADDMFRDGNVDKIVKFRQVLGEAAKYDSRIKPNEIMDQVKQKYMEYVLSKSTKPVAMESADQVLTFQAKSGVPDAATLARFFGEDKKKTTMNALLSPREQSALFDFGKALAATQTANPASLGMVMQLTQAGVVLNAAKGAEGAVRQLAGFLLPTTYAAKMMTNPTMVKLMTSAAKTPIWAKQAPVIASKLMVYYKNLKDAEEGKARLAEDVGNYLKGASNSMFGAEVQQ